MSKVKTVVPKVPSAKTLARYASLLGSVPQYSVEKLAAHSAEVSRVTQGLPLNMTSETEEMLKERCRIHDENEDRHDQQVLASLDELSPHARAAIERIIGKPKDFKAV